MLKLLDDESEDTNPDMRSARVDSTDSEVQSLPDDLHEAVGQLMGAVARLDARVRDLAPLASEVALLRKDIEEDRGLLVKDASKSAAHGTSNRMAALLGALGIVYEIAAPYLHELFRGVGH